jgi:hypothetical protein
VFRSLQLINAVLAASADHRVHVFGLGVIHYNARGQYKAAAGHPFEIL